MNSIDITILAGVAAGRQQAVDSLINTSRKGCGTSFIEDVLSLCTPKVGFTCLEVRGEDGAVLQRLGRMYHKGTGR
jgi:hypothetical protein